jgi:hypothetical protein
MIDHSAWGTYERVCNLFRQSNRGDIAIVLLLLTTVARLGRCNDREKRRDALSHRPFWAPVVPLPQLCPDRAVGLSIKLSAAAFSDAGAV